MWSHASAIVSGTRVPPRDGKCIRHRPREKRHLHQEYTRQLGKAFVIRLAFGYIRRRKRKCKAGGRAQGRDNEIRRAVIR